MTNGALRFGVYAGLGIVVGAIVAFLEWITLEVAVHQLIEADRWVQVILPIVGFALVGLLFRQVKTITPATSDSYVESFHTGSGAEFGKLPPKLFGSFLSIGSGGALGLEGPAVLTGATLGQWLGDRMPTVLGQRNKLVLVVAGAAAGIAALFKAPATGVLFAIESPYRRDLSRHGLIPALVASAAGYLTFVLLIDDEPLLRFEPTEVTLDDEFLAAILLGFLAGGVARGLAIVFRWAKHLDARVSFRVRFPIAAALTGASLLIAHAMVDLPATLGPGSGMATEIVRRADISFWALLVLFLVRMVATSASLSMSGIGGVFIPLVVQGLLLGKAVEILLDAPSSGLFPVIGLAAVLGAAYRTPLAAVVFVAESTGRAEFVIPALIATAISQSLMGGVSVSDGQRGERQGQLERRLNEPSSVVMIPEIGAVSPDSTLLEVIDLYGDRPVSLAVPVAGPTYEGLLVLHDLAAKMLEFGADATARQAMRDLPAVVEDAPAIDAARLMNEHDTAAIAVINDRNRPVGVISAMSLAGLDDASLLESSDD